MPILSFSRIGHKILAVVGVTVSLGLGATAWFYVDYQQVAELPEDARVLLVAESRALGFERRVELEHPFGEPRLLELARRSSRSGRRSSAQRERGHERA